MPPATKSPDKLTLRAYQVGFGDCFLLTWHYGAEVKHVLIDFGSNGSPKNGPPNLLKTVAQDIATECGGKLDAVVLTHRHKDHIAGFATSPNGKGPGDIIRGLKPDVVVQPWTEDPDAEPDAKRPTGPVGGPQGFTAMLLDMQRASHEVMAEAARLLATEPDPRNRPMFRRLQFAGEEGILNLSAVRNLQAMAPKKQHAYVYHGSKSGLEGVLPGVKITVLGPPTLEQSDAIRKERRVDQEQFWMLQANTAQPRIANGAPLFPRARKQSATRPAPYARWFIPRVRRMRAEGMQQVVRVLDDAMNNTSVILLFEVGDKSFLFPGDAQIENWQFTLDQKDLMKRLAKVTFYKVGHHGSRNATPKSLWNGFTNRSATATPGRLETMVSTMADKYGKTEGAEVPRQTLIRALQTYSTFFTTQSLKGKKALKKTVEYPL